MWSLLGLIILLLSSFSLSTSCSRCVKFLVALLAAYNALTTLTVSHLTVSLPTNDHYPCTHGTRMDERSNQDPVSNAMIFLNGEFLLVFHQDEACPARHINLQPIASLVPFFWRCPISGLQVHISESTISRIVTSQRNDVFSWNFNTDSVVCERF